MSRTYQAKYKCRLCGELFGDAITGNDGIARGCVSSACVGLKHGGYTASRALCTIHFCADGGFGVADFMGFECKEDWSEVEKQ